MRRQPRIKLLHTLLCDDVRHEVSHKQILIGVYTGDILVGAYPARIALQLWAVVEFAEKSEIDLKFRVIDEAGSVLLHMAGKAQGAKPSEPATLPVPKITLDLQKNSRLSFQWSVDNGRWRTILEKAVRLNPK